MDVGPRCRQRQTGTCSVTLAPGLECPGCLRCSWRCSAQFWPAPQPRPALQRLSAPASLHNGDRESEFEGFEGVKWLKINLTRQLKHVLAFSCLCQLVQVYFGRLWGDLSAEKGLSTGFWSALQRRVSSSASLRLALERHSAIQRLPFACTAAPSVRPAA